MGIVNFIVSAADVGLEKVATSQFAAVAEVSGTIVVGAATLAMIVLFINMAWQIRPMDGKELLVLSFKIALINTFAFNWANFNFVSGHIIDGLDELAGRLVGSAIGVDLAGPRYFALRFDLQLDRLAEYGNSATSHMGAVSKAVMGVFFMALLAVIGGAAGAVLVLAKMMMTFLIGIAPIMILCSMFPVTKDYFHRWVSSLASFALYPVVMAGVFSMVFGLVSQLVGQIGSPDSVKQVGATLPFLAVVILSLVMVVAIPFIVPMISGQLAGRLGSRNRWRQCPANDAAIPPDAAQPNALERKERCKPEVESRSGRDPFLSRYNRSPPLNRYRGQDATHDGPRGTSEWRNAQTVIVRWPTIRLDTHTLTRSRP